MLALQDLKGVVVIDEIQRAPHLFPILRVLADRTPVKARLLILGSASPNLVKGASESLAGRLEPIPVSGFGLAEVGAANLHRSWTRGRFPRSYLARSETDSLVWRRDFINTVLERDIPQLGIGISAPAMLRFWNRIPKNLTREDVRGFLDLVSLGSIHATVNIFGLEEANLALAKLKASTWGERFWIFTGEPRAGGAGSRRKDLTRRR